MNRRIFWKFDGGLACLSSTSLDGIEAKLGLMIVKMRSRDASAAIRRQAAPRFSKRSIVIIPTGLISSTTNAAEMRFV